MAGNTTVETKYLTVPEIAADAGVKVATVHNWLKYHRYMPFTYVLDRPVVERTDYDKFKAEHPELIQKAA